MGWRDLFGHKAETTEDLMRRADAAAASAVAPIRAPQQSYPQQSDPLQHVESLVRSGERIEAIKVYRDHYCVSLADAKEAVDAIARGERPVAEDPASEPAATPTGHSGDAAVQELIVRGQLIDAIKLYRELHGVGLAEAKSAVDAMRAAG